MTKVLVGNIGTYTFDASAKTVTLTGLPTLDIEQVLLITNVKDGSNEIIFQFDLIAKGGTISGNVITLAFDTTSMNDTDPLQIFVDIANDEAPLTSKIEGDTSGNVAEVTAANALQVDTSAGGTGTNKIEGDTSGNKVEVNASNQLEVINTTPNKIQGSTSGNVAEVSAANQLKVLNETPVKMQGSTSGNIVEVTASNALKVDASGSGAANIKIEGDTSGNVAEVTANKGLQVEIIGGAGDVVNVTTSGELRTVNPPPIAPSGTDPFRIVQKGSVSSNDFFTVITNTKTMVLQRVSGGCEPSAAGAVVEIYFAPNGNTTGIEIIEDIYVQGSSGQKDLNQEFTGDGTAAILLRRRVFGGSAVEITGRWEGYEE